MKIVLVYKFIAYIILDENIFTFIHPNKTHRVWIYKYHIKLSLEIEMNFPISFDINRGSKGLSYFCQSSVCSQSGLFTKRHNRIFEEVIRFCYKLILDNEEVIESRKRSFWKNGRDRVRNSFCTFLEGGSLLLDSYSHQKDLKCTSIYVNIYLPFATVLTFDY